MRVSQTENFLRTSLNFKLQSFASLKDLLQPTRPMPSPPSNLYADEVKSARDAEDRETFYYAPQKKPFSIDRYYLKEHSLFSPCGHAIQVPEIATPSSNESTWFLLCAPSWHCKVGLCSWCSSNQNISFCSSSMSWKLAAAEKLAVLEAEDEEDQFLTLLPASQQPIA